MELIFVYNANTSLLSQIVDYGHKVFSPSTYKCSLCELTHHNFGERKIWTRFRKESEVEMRFLYIEEFVESFDLKWKEYPAIFVLDKDSLRLLLGADELDSLGTVEELISVIEEKLNIK